MTLEQYLKQHYTEDTAKIYGYEIGNYTANYPQAAQAVYKDVVSYIGTLRTRYSKASTLNRILCSIKAYYDFLCYTGQRSDNPARSIKLRDQRSRDIQLQDLFTTEELEALLNRPERYNNLAYRNSVLMSLLIYQALQPGEIEALRVNDINLRTGSIYIKATTKTNKRELQLKPNQILLFYQYIHEIRPKLLQEKQCDALSIGLRGKPMKAGDITDHVARSYKDLYPGREVNAQTIRQSVIANLLKQGHDLSLVQGFAGHKYPSSTERYKQNEIETLKAAVQKHHPMR
jgi:Site-specific recombinase XerD